MATPPRRRACIMLSILCAVGGTVAPAGSAAAGTPCTFTPLPPGQTMTFTNDGAFAFDVPMAPAWVVGVRSATAAPWTVTELAAGDPPCGSRERLSSVSTGAVNLILGFESEQPDSEYVHALGTGAASAQWTAAAAALTVDGAAVNATVDSGAVVAAYTVTLANFATYTIEFTPAGAADLHVLLFRNPAPGSSFYADRTAKLFENTATSNYAAMQTGSYLLVVTHENPSAGSYTLRVSRCASRPNLQNGQLVDVVPPVTKYSFFVSSGLGWSAVGVRRFFGADEAWMVSAYGALENPAPDCASGLLDSDSRAGAVAFLALESPTFKRVDLNFTPAQGASLAKAQWAQPVAFDQAGNFSGSTPMFKTWAPYFYAGQLYKFHVDDLAPGTHLLLFRNPAPGTLAAFGRDDREFDMTAPGDLDYAATVTGRHLLAVVNDDGAGTFSFSVDGCRTAEPLQPGNVTLSYTGTYPMARYSVTPFWRAWNFIAAYPDFSLQSGVAAKVYTADGPPLACGTTLLAQDVRSHQVALLVGDLRKQDTSTRVLTVEGLGALSNTDLRWNQGADELSVNGADFAGNFAGSAFLHCAVYTIPLTGGSLYWFNFRPPAGSGHRLLLFRNNGNPWMGRSDRILDIGEPAAFLAPATDSYAVVVVDDASVGGTYRLQVTTSGPGHQCDDRNGNGLIGLYTDTEGTIPCATTPPGGGTQTLYVIATLAGATAGGIRGAGFAVWADASGFSFGNWTPNPAAVCTGNPFNAGTGVKMTFANVQGAAAGDRVFLGTLSMSTGPGVSGRVLVARAFTPFLPSCVLLYDADLDPVCITPTLGTPSIPVSTRLGVNTACPCVPATVDVHEPAVPPARLRLVNVPDPFNPSTELRYELPVGGEVTVDIFDVRGRLVRHLLRATQEAGSHRVVWNGDGTGGTRVSSGVYFATLRSPGGTVRERLTLTK